MPQLLAGLGPDAASDIGAPSAQKASLVSRASSEIAAACSLLFAAQVGPRSFGRRHFDPAFGAFAPPPDDQLSDLVHELSVHRP